MWDLTNSKLKDQNLMNLSWVADLPSAGANLNHRFKIRLRKNLDR